MTNGSRSVRVLVVVCPDWAIVAAGVALDVPAAVLRANRVLACSPAARTEGVAVDQRRRDAQARCPDLVVLNHDPAGEARAFEPVLQALEALTPRIEITTPGSCAFATRGPSRYFGGDQALAARAEQTAGGALGDRGPVRVGVADGPFAARLAAQRASAGPLVVPAGASGAFLAPLPVAVLTEAPELGERHDMVDVFGRLGLARLGDLAALPVDDVVGRFGAPGRAAHRLACGLDPRPPATEPPPPDLTVALELDPPIERAEAAAFVARAAAEDLLARLAERGSACTRLAIGAETEHGERHERVWRTDGGFAASAVADRLRWQLDGWLAGAHRPTGPLTRLWLAPDEVVPAGGRQLALPTTGPGAVDPVAAAERAARALARVQALVGADGVRVPEWRGGRGPGERVALVPAAATDLTGPHPAARAGWVAGPWPGQIPAPAPALVHHPAPAAEVLDAAGHPLVVSARGELSAPPATIRTAGDGETPVDGWAGPWPCVERWWDPTSRRRRARLQVATTTGVAHLLVAEGGRWWVEATYD
ncbi:MAG TPA: DNA polymerase Y family protein [Acidimicrobiales bacterium]|nr:DNA polymerase Y family protein [Acidimicrobiales bacterium]